MSCLFFIYKCPVRTSLGTYWILASPQTRVKHPYPFQTNCILKLFEKKLKCN